MNINALLSPSDSPAREGSSSAGNSPRKARPTASGGKRATSILSQEVKRSPEDITSNPSSRPTSAHDSPTISQPSYPAYTIAHAVVQKSKPLQQSPTSNPSPALSPSHHGRSSNHQSYQRPVVTHRPSSTPQMEALADLASMQQHQQTSRTSLANDIPKTRSSALVNPPANASPPLFRNTSGRSLADLTMAEAPAQTPPPRHFESSGLSELETQRITDLLSYLAEKSYAYESHLELVGLLHKGLLAHVYGPADNNNENLRDPKTYGLLTELRQAREAMDTRFAVGEELWVEWLSDEILLATTSEERIGVTELCQKAVQDEPASVRLWHLYADWVSSNHAACHGLKGSDQTKWTEEDKEVCRELFTQDMLLSVVEQGAVATQWRVDQSHVLWNWYAELIQQNFPVSPTKQEIERLRNMFIERLQVPHAKWDETAQHFWPIVTKYEGNNWEGIMAEVNQLAAPAKQQMALREEHELRLQRAIDAGDKSSEFDEFTQYLQSERKHETKHKQRAPFVNEVRCALFERALLRFPTFTDWWLDYVDFVTGSSTSISVLPIIERATRHCPWSGDLWARRILQADVERKPHHEIEATKHRATNSGLLDVGGMEELVKVLQQWCSYLRRHAFTSSSTEDDLDTAEVGITMALEDIQQAGEKIYGKNVTHDPLLRLETIQVKFLSEGRRFEDARAIYQNLIPHHKDSLDFWRDYYIWELWLWGVERLKDPHRVETAQNGPDRATAVLQQALSQRNLDQPEKFLNLYLNHFQQHESSERLRTALIDSRDFTKHLATRRAKEAEAAAEQQAYQAAETQIAEDPVGWTGEKRKRDDETLPNGHDEKKAKMEHKSVPEVGFGEPFASASAQIKRDRENNTITMKNLPTDVQELDVKKFFRDISAPVSINIQLDRDANSATAVVEFESQEDATFAKTRNGRELNGREVHIHGGSQSTLYVANYPPEYDEAAIRRLFNSYGEIVSVRLPSLKFNNRRRFCYVQFLTSDMARAAEAAMDSKMLDGNHKLLAKISDPDAKKERSGAQAEGRELFVKNIERTAPDHEIKNLFEQYGNVVSMNVVKLVSGKRTGTTFIVFSSADEATAALELNNKPFHDRILHVELASAKGRAAPMDRARKEDVIVKQGGSASPEPDRLNGRRGSDVSMGMSAQANDESWKTARARKIAIFNLPDTVNDARVRSTMEEYGPLVKIQMRRDDRGAIVEFANVNDAFKVRQGVDCSALGPDVSTGDVADLLAKVKKRQADQSGSAPTAGSTMRMRPASIARPGQRGGRRGGLGFKRGGASNTGRNVSGEDADGAAGDAKSGGKSNADFRSMFEKSKGDAAPTDAGA